MPCSWRTRRPRLRQRASAPSDWIRARCLGPSAFGAVPSRGAAAASATALATAHASANGSTGRWAAIRRNALRSRPGWRATQRRAVRPTSPARELRAKHSSPYGQRSTHTSQTNSFDPPARLPSNPALTPPAEPSPPSDRTAYNQYLPSPATECC